VIFSSASPGASYGLKASVRSFSNFAHPAKLSPCGVLASIKYCPFQEAASPSFMKDKVYAIFFLSVLYISSFISRYKITSCMNRSNSSLFPENGFGGFIFSSVGLAAGVVKVGPLVGPSGGTMVNGLVEPISWSDDPCTTGPNTVAIMSTSGSGFGFVCSVRASKNCSTVSDNTGAVEKLSWVSIVSGVRRSGSVVGSLHSRSILNASKLDISAVCPLGSSTALRVKGAGSSSSGDGLSSSSNPKNPPLLEDVLVQVYLAS